MEGIKKENDTMGGSMVIADFSIANLSILQKSY